MAYCSDQTVERPSLTDFPAFITFSYVYDPKNVLHNANAQTAGNLRHPARYKLKMGEVANSFLLPIEGDAVDLLLPVIYDELRKLVASYLRRVDENNAVERSVLT